MAMTDRQAVNLENANSGPNPWACPFADCEFEGTSYDRWRHIRDAHE